MSVEAALQTLFVVAAKQDLRMRQVVGEARGFQTDGKWHAHARFGACCYLENVMLCSAMRLCCEKQRPLRLTLRSSSLEALLARNLRLSGMGAGCMG